LQSSDPAVSKHKEVLVVLWAERGLFMWNTAA
jgi:hypothetical protein